MKNTILLVCTAMAVVAVIMATGCAPPAVEHPPTFSVSGTVTLDEAPVEGATVSFMPDGSGDAAVGKTDASGKYTLTSFGSVDGATPGQYKVMISKYAFAEGSGSGAAEEMPDNYAPVENAEQGKSQIPDKYADPGQSGLTATVTEDASQNVFDFALVGEGKAAPPAKE